MVEHRFPSASILHIALACAILLPTLCSAQENPETETTEPNASRCADLALFPKLATSIVVTCDGGDSIEVSMPLKPDAQGYAREKSVRGTYEFREYQMPQADQQELAYENLMQLLPIAGFTVKYSNSPSTITARKEGIWILINVREEFYNASVIHTNEVPWTRIKDAEGISQEMDSHYRAAIYGIEFSPDNQAVIEANSKILTEVLRYLKGNPSLAVIVESHKMSEKGNAEDDQEITMKRAHAVVAWLEAQGIAAGRLQPKALGRSKPITENDTPLEIQRNERVELAKPAS
jgi:outer membrane protein OmpA-like peptidoglycan-associated protein